MVADTLEKLCQYLPPPVSKKILPFLESLNASMAEGEYPIDGKRIFARVMRYATKPEDECLIEAHNCYIDIQSTLKGAEGIGVYTRAELQESISYDPKKDVAFFHSDTTWKYAQTVNLPGYFTLLFPHEAHSPMQQVGGFSMVKKLVIKVAVEAYE